MTLTFLIYLAATVGKLSDLLGLVVTFGLISILIIPILIILGVTGDPYSNESFPWPIYHKKAIILFSLIIVTNVFLPSKQTMYLMVAAYATEQVVTNERVQNVSDDLLELIEMKLQEAKKQ